jgi:hypothetical protein
VIDLAWIAFRDLARKSAANPLSRKQKLPFISLDAL